MIRIAVVAAIAGGSTMAACGYAIARPLDDVIATKELRVIIYDENEPFSYDDGGVLKGFDVDLARALAAKLGVAVKIDLRMQGERLDQDLRTNLLRGTFGGGAIGDVMMHVPVDRDYLYGRVAEIFVANPYFEQRVALGLTAAFPAPTVETFDSFKSHKIAVQLGTVADYFLMRFADGALVNNVVHYVRPPQGAKLLSQGSAVAVLGVQSSLESLLRPQAETLNLRWVIPPMPGLARQSWRLGMGFGEGSRDLSYALGNHLKELRADGTLAAIAKAHGLSYVAPEAAP